MKYPLAAPDAIPQADPIQIWRQHRLARRRLHYQEHKEHILKSNRLSWHKHKQTRLVKQKKYYEDHKLAILQQQKMYKRRNHEKVKAWKMKHEKTTETGRAWRRAKKRRYYWRHREDIHARAREYRQRNKDAIATKGHAYYVQNKASIADKRRQYKLANPHKVKAWLQNRRARRAAAKGAITPEQWRAILGAYRFRCAYCGKKRKLEMDHVIPLSSNGDHSIGNVVPACQKCNLQKGTRQPKKMPPVFLLL